MKKSSESTGRQSRDKGVAVATKQSEIVSLTCNKRNSNENSHERPFAKIPLQKLASSWRSVLTGEPGSSYPFSCCRRACTWGWPLAVWKYLSKWEMPVRLEPALAVLSVDAKDAHAWSGACTKNLHFLDTIRKKKVEMTGVSTKKQLHPVFKCQHQLCSPTHPPLCCLLCWFSARFSLFDGSSGLTFTAGTVGLAKFRACLLLGHPSPVSRGMECSINWPTVE